MGCVPAIVYTLDPLLDASNFTVRDTHSRERMLIPVPFSHIVYDFMHFCMHVLTAVVCDVGVYVLHRCGADHPLVRAIDGLFVFAGCKEPSEDGDFKPWNPFRFRKVHPSETSSKPLRVLERSCEACYSVVSLCCT